MYTNKNRRSKNRTKKQTQRTDVGRRNVCMIPCSMNMSKRNARSQNACKMQNETRKKRQIGNASWALFIRSIPFGNRQIVRIFMCLYAWTAWHMTIQSNKQSSRTLDRHRCHTKYVFRMCWYRFSRSPNNNIYKTESTSPNPSCADERLQDTGEYRQQWTKNLSHSRWPSIRNNDRCIVINPTSDWNVVAKNQQTHIAQQQRQHNTTTAPMIRCVCNKRSEYSMQCAEMHDGLAWPFQSNIKRGWIFNYIRLCCCW